MWIAEAPPRMEVEADRRREIVEMGELIKPSIIRDTSSLLISESVILCGHFSRVNKKKIIPFHFLIHLEQ